jgi:ribonucleoside-diphosphate reductase alpha chain
MTVSKSENAGQGTRDTMTGQENISFDFILAPEELTDNAKVVLAKRYLKRDGEGTPLEEPEDLFRRVAENIAQAEKKFGGSDEKVAQTAELYFNLMSSLSFMPNSPTLMNAGRELQQLSACFVLPIGDSMESIFDAVKHTAMIHKSGGGTGFSFSRLRPGKDVVKSTSGVSSGPISFMKVFNQATEVIKQGGTRRGANMGILRIDHPDILNFIRCKEENDQLNNFNISVGLTEEFMKAVADDEEYPLLNPRTGEEATTLRAREVFQLIVEKAHQNGEPGIIFLDRINRENPTPHLGEMESTNPCGEQPLLPYESCNLGSINLTRTLKYDGSRVSIDYDKLGQVVSHSVRFLDNVIEMNRYPLEQIEEMTKKNRKIGLGIMGFADLLFRLGIPYNSEEAVALAEKVMGFVHQIGMEASSKLAEERGAFPAHEGSVFDVPGRPPVRNATVTTIAPTGTISILANTSSGIEPLFAIAFQRNVMDNQRLLEVHPYFKEVAKREGFYSEELMEQIVQEGTLQHIAGIPDWVKKVFVTSHDISPEWHIRMQAAFQKYTDNAVSKTVNFPNDATRNDIEEVYLLAYELGCKGVTVYRDGSRDEQVLSVGNGQGKAVVPAGDPGMIMPAPRPRPALTQGMTIKMKTGCGNLYVTINEDEKGLCEVFTQMGKAGGCAGSQSESVSRMVSLALRSGIEADAILRQLSGIRCPSPLWQNGEMILSCSDAIAKAMRQYVEIRRERGDEPQKIVDFPATGGRSGQDVEDMIASMGRLCPDCSGSLEFGEGCATCHSCGYSKCS